MTVKSYSSPSWLQEKKKYFSRRGKDILKEKMIDQTLIFLSSKLKVLFVFT